MNGYRSHALWLAHLMHRLSGVALVVFLPFHFYVLSLALTAPEDLDAFLTWTDYPLVKLAEGGLVFMLAVHLFGGLRLMVFERRPWSGSQKTLAAGAVAGAGLVSGLFLLNAI